MPENAITLRQHASYTILPNGCLVEDTNIYTHSTYKMYLLDISTHRKLGVTHA